MALDEQDDNASWDRYVAIAQALHTSSRASFCPAFHATPSLLSQKREFKEGEPGIYPGPGVHTHVCFCGFILQYTMTDYEQTVSGSCHIFLRQDRHDPMPKDWVKMISPDSYGHFADQETKNITWCDDRSCSTTFKLMRFTAMVRMAAVQGPTYFRDHPDTAARQLDGHPLQYLRW